MIGNEKSIRSLLRVWVQPRAVVGALISQNPKFPVLKMSLLVSLFLHLCFALFIVVSGLVPPASTLFSFLAVEIVLTFFVGIAAVVFVMLNVSSLILHYICGLFKGETDIHKNKLVLIATLFSMLPIMLFVLLLCAFHSLAMAHAGFDSSILSLAAILFCLLGILGTGISSGVVCIKGVAEANGLSTARATAICSIGTLFVGAFGYGMWHYIRFFAEL